MKSVFDRVDQLAEEPESGRENPELEVSIFREVIVSHCRIFYRIEVQKLFIVAVMREEQQFRNPFY